MGNTSIQTQSYRAVDKDAGQSRSYIIPFALLCSLFFLWAVANNLNDILLPQFQQAFTLTNFQAGLIQSAFYFGYFKSVGILFMFLCLIGYGYSMDFVLNGGNKIKGCTALCKAYFSAPCGNCSCAVLGVFHKSEQWAGHTHSL